MVQVILEAVTVCFFARAAFCNKWMMMMLQLGVSIEVADAKGCTPLIIASQYGQTMLVGYLIGKGASLFAADREGDTALHWAAFKGDRFYVCC